MKYTIQDFHVQFPDDDACLEYVFQKKYADYACSCGRSKFYRVKGRKAYACRCGKQIYPLAGTIFEKSRTSLRLWFYAIFLFSSSKNGVAAKELERQLGVTYKTAWRLANSIRNLMTQDTDPLSGIVEADETYVGAKKRLGCWKRPHVPVMGMVERKGRARVEVLPNQHTHVILNSLERNVEKGTHLMTDEAWVYKKAPKLGYTREAVKHSAKEYVRGNVHTNTIEGFWGQLKRSLHGTYHAVSSKHLQSYVNEFVFRYNYRTSHPSKTFEVLLERI